MIIAKILTLLISSRPDGSQLLWTILPEFIMLKSINKTMYRKYHPEFSCSIIITFVLLQSFYPIQPYSLDYIPKFDLNQRVLRAYPPGQGTC
jgi:hypothetical protein